MSLGFYRLIYYACLYLLGMTRTTNGITLTVIPSNRVTVNQTVTLQCMLDPNPTPPVYVSFDIQSPHSTVCLLEPSFGVCKNTPNPCIDMYSASCPSDTQYSIQGTVPWDWNEKSVACRTVYNQSNTVIFSVMVGPLIQIQAVTKVNETERVVLTGNISSNPLSNVSWYDGSHMLKFENAVNTTYLIIEEAKCTDTRNFTLTASNAVRVNVTSSVQLIVNCKPGSDVINITLGVTDITGIVFSTTVIAYPKPQYALLFENGTKARDILDNIKVNAMNNFTIHFNKTIIQQDDFGFYRLFINNTFGETVIYVAVLPQRTPNSPIIVEIACSVKTAKIQWKSSFNGGSTQTFKALVIFEQRLVSQSQIMNDYGEYVIHNAQLTNLQPTTKYAFYIVAQNKCGNSSSERRECTTLEEPRNQAPLIAGCTIGSLGLVIFILVAVFFFHRRYTCNIRDERRKGSTNGKDNEESHYTSVTEHENTERNVYDELDNCHSQYESVLAKDREEDEKKIYEKLQKLETGNEVQLYDQTHVHSAEGSTKPLHDLSTQCSTSEYMNTSFTQ